MVWGPSSNQPSSQRLGPYSIVRPLGEGGMGVVYEAAETLSGRRVAIKALHPHLARVPGARERFFAEMRITATLDHPNIVRCLACTEIDGHLVIVLEFLQGRTLRDTLVAEGRMPASRAAHIGAAIASALAAAHAATPPVVHRDLKPENVMLLPNGGVKVMDFGIARTIGAAKNGSTAAIGTALYMSPEQINGAAIGPATDLYALGAVLYEMVSGAPPFVGSTVMATLRDQCERPPPPFAPDVQRGVPPELDGLIRAMLEKVPARRPARADMVARALEEIAAKSGAPWPGSASQSGQQARPLTPSAALGGPALAGGQRSALDTFQLIEGRPQPKARGGSVALVAASIAVVAGLAAGGWLLFQRFGPGAPFKLSRSAAPSGSSDVPIVSTKSCLYTLCATFDPPDPARVDVDAAMSAGGDLARSLDKAASLTLVSINGTAVDGRLDWREAALVTMIFTLPKGGQISVMLNHDGFSLMKLTDASFGLKTVIDPGECTFERAWRAARDAGKAPPNPLNVSLVALQNGKLAWQLSSAGGSTMVWVTTPRCAIDNVR